METNLLNFFGKIIVFVKPKNAYAYAVPCVRRELFEFNLMKGVSML